MQEEVKHYKVKKLPVKLRPNSVYYVKESSESSVKTYITDQNGFPFPLIDLASLSLTGIVNSVTGTGVTGTAKARFQKWIKLREITTQGLSYGQSPIGKQDIRIQIKGILEWTGDCEFIKSIIDSDEFLKISA
jgi:hypothetical protein